MTDFVDIHHLRLQRARVELVRRIKDDTTLSKMEIKDRVMFVKKITSRQLQLYYMRLCEADITNSDCSFCENDADRRIMMGFSALRARLCADLMDVLFEQHAKDLLND